MRVKRIVGVVGAIAAASVVLSACTSGAVPSDAQGPGASEIADVPAVVTPDDLPLHAFTPTATNEEVTTLMRRQQQVLAECMAERGFDFQQASDLPEPPPAPGADLDMKSKAFAETYGYGVFNNPFGSANLVDALLASAEEIENPNEAYYEGLEAERQQQFMEALNGGMGCVNQADDAVYGANPWDAEQFRQLVNDMKSIYAKTQADERTAELNAAWVTCMADAGYSGLTVPASAHEAFTAELGVLQQRHAAANPPVRGQQLPALDLESPEAQDALARELAQAKTDWQCRSSLDYDNEMLRTQYKHEQAFVAQNEATLEAFRDALTAWRQG